MATGFKINSDDLDVLFEPAATGVASVTFSYLSPTIKFTAKYNGDNPNAGGYYNYKSGSSTYAYAAQDMWDLNGLIEGKVTTKYLTTDCTNLTSYAFAGCNNLVNVNGPEVSYIYERAFHYCSNLTTVNFPNCISIHTGAFEDCDKLNSINFPNCTHIGNYAFGYCSSLTTASFPKCIYIEGRAFMACRSLNTLYFPSCSYIGNYAFNDCYSLNSISFPECTTIYDRAFAYCGALTTVSFPKCSSIGWGAFVGCSALTTVSFPKVTTIEEYAFEDCVNLRTIYIGTSNCTLQDSTAFENTSIDPDGGQIYVPNAYVTTYKNANNWSYFYNIIRGY